MAIVVTIDGTARSIADGSLRFEGFSGERPICHVDVVSEDGSYRPTEGDPVMVTVDGTDEFGGFVTVPVERGVVGPFAPIVTSVTAVGWHGLLEQQRISATFTGTLEDRLTALVALLDGGITLDAAQETGATLEDATYEDETAAEILEQWRRATGWEARITPGKVLRMRNPSGDAAPFSVTSGDGNIIGDLVVENAPTTQYANRLILRCGTGTRLDELTQQFTQAGSETEYVTTYDASTSIDDPWPNVLILNGVAAGVVSWGYDAAFQWYWNAAAHKLVNTGAAISAGTTVDVTYSVSSRVQFDDAAEQASYGRRVDAVEAVSNITTIAQAMELGPELLAVRTQRAKLVRYVTRTAGLKVNQTQTINVAIRNINASCLIVGVEASVDIDGALRYAITATSATVAPRAWQATVRAWSRGVATAASGSLTVTSVTAASGYVFLGAGQTEWQEGTSGDWIPAGAVQVVLDPAERGATTATVWVRLRADSGSVTARLRDVTNNVTAGTSTAVSSTTYVTVAFAVTLSSGSAAYELQLSPSVSNSPVNGVGYLK